MTATARPGFGHPAIWLSTWFGVGYVPRGAGPLAALTALPLAWGLLRLGGSYGGGIVFVAATVLFWTALWAVSLYCRADGTAAHEVAVDKVVGQWLPLMFVRPDQLWQFAVAFLLFGAFGLIRPWPVSWADEYVPGGWGLMLDDFFAGIYAAVCMYAIVHVAEQPYVARLVERTF